jgi:carboxypeptidase T
MKKCMPRFVLICLLFFAGTNMSAADKLVGIKLYLPKDPAARNEVLGKLEIDHFRELDGAVYQTLHEKQVEILKTLPCRFEVLPEDVMGDYEAENKAYYKNIKKQQTAEKIALEQTDRTLNNIILTPGAFQVKPTLGGYYNYAEMVAAMDALVAAYPALAQKFSIGTSVEGRTLWCVKISDNVSTDETTEPELLYTGLVHAREAISGSSMIFLMQYLCENYASDTRIGNLVDNREFFIIPCANPDGWEYNRSTNPNGGGQWRKNRKNNGDGSYGVDLNRNWSADWANCSGAIGAPNCGSGSGSSDVYWGTTPFSEPETNHLKNFIESRNFSACLDQHAVGPYYSLPYGRLFRSLTSTEKEIYTQLCSAMGKYNGMRYGNTYETLGYEVSGAMKDWMLLGGDSGSIDKIYGITGEGGNGSSAVAFWPLAADIIPLCKGMVYQDLQLAYSAGPYVDLQDIGKLSLSSRTGKFYFQVRRIGLQDQPVTVTVVPLNNITSVGSPVTITGLSNFNDIHTDSISYVLPNNLGNGGNIRFAWKVETGGYTYYDTIVNLYNPVILFSDNMEGALVGTNWTVSSGWNYTTDAAYQGIKSLAESPGGNLYSNNVSLSAQLKSFINLQGAGIAYLSFYVRHRAENFRDKLQVQVSTNGNSWAEVPGRTTIKEPGLQDGSTINGKPSLTGIREFWTREVFDLKNFLGNKNLRVRLVFTSNGSDIYVYGRDQGFNIDNLVIMKASAAPALLTIKGNHEFTKNIISWNTEGLQTTGTNSFTVERSNNGIDYQALGIIDADPHTVNYSFTDEDPYRGENLYRVQVIGGPAGYRTNVIAIYSQTGKTPVGIEQVFPNPATGKLQIYFQAADESATFIFSVYNMAGRQIISEKRSLGPGLHQEILDVSAFPAGEYILSFIQPETGVSYEKSFIKQ